MATTNDVEAAVRCLAPQKAELEAQRETKNALMRTPQRRSASALR